MNYSEAAYFEGAHVAHIVAWQDHRRLLRAFGMRPGSKGLFFHQRRRGSERHQGSVTNLIACVER